MNVRNAILRGVAGATETHEAFTLREQHGDGLNPIDVFGLIDELEIPLQFKPLDKLLGACVRVDDTTVGIMVTTQRDLHMQRFTAAHELGHFVLDHEGSFDSEIRMPGHTEGRELREVEADAFAAELLMPKWLVRRTAERRSWWSEASLIDPDIIYQLSLRLAASYEATCWALASHQFVTHKAAKSLTEQRPKVMKLRALDGIRLDDPWADVWVLGQGDNGSFLNAGRNDVFIVDLEERATAGFRWDPHDALEEGLRLLYDGSIFDPTVVGGTARRRLVLQAPQGGVHDLRLPLRRSFSKAMRSINVLQMSISTLGSKQDSTLMSSKTTSSLVH